MKRDIKLQVRPKIRLIQNIPILNNCSGRNRLDRGIVGNMHTDSDRFRQGARLFLYEEVVDEMISFALDNAGRLVVSGR